MEALSGPLPFRRASWVLLAIGLGCGLGAGRAAYVSSMRTVAGNDFVGLLAVVGFIVAGAALIGALALAFAKNGANTLLEQFRRGEALVDWTFSPEEWEAFLAKRLAASRKAAMSSALATAALVLLAVVILAFESLDTRPRVEVIAAGVVGAAVLFWGLRWLIAAYAARWISRMNRNPRVLIGRNGVWCGGDVTQWNGGMTVLKAINLRGNDPCLIELVAGPGKAAGVLDGVATMAGMLSVLTGGEGGYAGAAKSVTVLVPVPAGRQAEVAKLTAVLLPGPAAAASAAG